MLATVMITDGRVLLRMDMGFPYTSCIEVLKGSCVFSHDMTVAQILPWRRALQGGAIGCPAADLGVQSAARFQKLGNIWTLEVWDGRAV